MTSSQSQPHIASSGYGILVRRQRADISESRCDSNLRKRSRLEVQVGVEEFSNVLPTYMEIQVARPRSRFQAARIRQVGFAPHTPVAGRLVGLSVFRSSITQRLQSGGDAIARSILAEEPGRPLGRERTRQVEISRGMLARQGGWSLAIQKAGLVPTSQLYIICRRREGYSSLSFGPRRRNTFPPFCLVFAGKEGKAEGWRLEALGKPKAYLLPSRLSSLAAMIVVVVERRLFQHQIL